MQRRQISGPIAALALLLGITQTSVSASVSNTESLPTAAVAVDRSDASGTRLSIRVPEIGMMQSVSHGDDADRPALGEEPTTLTPGFPALPMIVRTVLVPPSSGVRIVIHNLQSRTEQDFTPFIAPTQDGSADLDLSGIPSEEYLGTPGFWPPEPVVLSEPAILRGYRMVQVLFYPIQVNPTTREVRYNENADVELVYDGEGVNPVVDPSRPRPSGNIQKIIESMVVNPPTPVVQRDDIPGRGCYMLVYYNTQGVANSLAPLIAWRQRQGWNVVLAGFNANTSANTIKEQIQDQYDGANPPEMIALVGDPDWGGNGVPPWAQTTDQGYALLEGNDVLAEADYGRISAASTQELDRVIAKIINYESDPYMENVAWYHNGAVCAGEAGSGISTVFINRWVRRKALERTWTNVAEWYYINGQGSVPQFYRDQFNRGISFMTYRGYIGMSGVTANDIMNYQASRRYPFVTNLTCSSGDYVGTFGNSEAFFRSAGGGIGAIGFCTPQTHTQYNNIVFSGIWQGIFEYDLFNLGSACNYGRYEIWRQYAGTGESAMVANFSSWANLMGDPATEFWTDEPLLVDATYDETFPIGGSRVSVTVTDQAEGNPIARANVCLFKADDEFQMVILTDENGVAEFPVPFDALSEGDDLLVTVTKHNVKPHLGAITVAQAEQFLGVESWEISQDNDGDGVANPGESFSFDMQLKNFGAETPDGALIITGESLSSFATVDGAEVQIDQAPAADEAVAASLIVSIDPTAPDGAVIPVAITTRSDVAEWKSMAAIEVEAPKINIERLHIPNERFNPGTVIDLDVTLENVGHKTLGAAHATLWSETSSVTVIAREAVFDELDPQASGRINGNLFRIRSHPFTIPGSTAILKLAVETESGFRDTTSTTITVGRGAVTDPFGPDKYGYVCFDSGDEAWEMKPVYDWVEIDPNVQQHNFDGTLLNLQDQGEDADRALAIDLPFMFQYYGEEFDQLTICSNGWAAFGNWIEIPGFRNRRIASAEGPEAMLAVFWDDMTTGRIITFYDEEAGRFIVEWNGMRSLSSGESQTFELVLHDVRTFPTYSGDGVILYQYKDVSNPAGYGPSNDTPYATIGLSNLNNTDGLEYTYYNAYNPGAKRLEDQLAIKFTTAIQFITGAVTGYVTDYATGMPIAGAEVVTTRGFWGETDENGHYLIDDILIGDYNSITVRKQGYNDSTWVGFEGVGFSIFEAETLSVDHALLHPEFINDAESFEFTMLADSTTSTGFFLSNNGNGTLWFNSRFATVLEEERDEAMENRGPIRTLRRDEPDDQWDPLLRFNLTEQVGNLRMQSITYVRDHWFVAGGHQAEGENLFYEFSKDGQYTGVSFPQPVGGLYGIRDMEYYNGYVYGTYADSSWLVKIDPTDGTDLGHWRTPRGFNNPRNITIDPATGHFWMSGVTSRLFELALIDTVIGDTAQVDTQMFVEIRRLNTTDPRTNTEMHEYGISWFRDDPDGFNIYLLSSDEVENDNSHPNIALFKMHPVTGETRFLTDLPFMDSTAQARGGMTITPKWDNGVYALAAVFDQDQPVGDNVGVFELAPNSSWIDYSPRLDTLIAGEQIPIEINIASADLDTGKYQVVLEFRHNAGDGMTRIPVQLDVVTVLPINDLEESVLIPLEYSLAPIWPNPFNSRASIAYSLKNSGKVRLEVFDANGRLVSTLVKGEQSAGRYRVVFDGEGLSAGLYFYRLKSGNFSTSQKMLLLK